MSVAEQLEVYGAIAYLVTVNGEGRPHVVAVRVDWDGEALATEAGPTTVGNAGARPDVTVVWAAPPGAGYSFILDGIAAADAAGGLRITPTRAVLHRTPEGDPSAPNCVTVLDRRSLR